MSLTDFLAETTERAEAPARTDRARRAPGARPAVNPGVRQVQAFLLKAHDGRNVIGSRTGRPDGAWGPRSNQALINLVNEYAGNPEEFADKPEVAKVLAELAKRSKNLLSKDPDETAGQMNNIAAIVQAGGEIKGKEFGKTPVRDIPVEFRGISITFPVFDAVRDPSLRALNSVMVNEVLWPYWQQPNTPSPPATMKELDKELMQEALRDVLGDIIQYIDTKVDPQKTDQRIQQAKTVIRERFNKLHSTYMGALEEKDRPRNVRDALLERLAYIFQQVAGQPQLKEAMLDRAAAVMREGGATDEHGNIRSKNLFNSYLGRVQREMLAWVDKFGGKGMTQYRVQRQQQQSVQQPTSPPTMHPAMKAVQQIPTQRPDLQEAAKGIRPPQTTTPTYPRPIR